MGKATGFLEYARQDNVDREPLERLLDYGEFHLPLKAKARREQGARCMNCGVPLCQSAMRLHGMVTGCPLHNMIPEWNDQVYLDHVNHALSRLLKTSNFPEFTGRVCPALCEKACVCGMNDDPVTIHDNELYIIETAFEKGWMQPRIPAQRSGKRVAVVGSGPSGLAAADQLNHRGHQVTVFEREDRIGGLLMYGIPNMKLDKSVIERRRKLMEAEGVEFRTGVNVDGEKAQEILAQYDAVILACGAKNPRSLTAKIIETGKAAAKPADPAKAKAETADPTGPADPAKAKAETADPAKPADPAMARAEAADPAKAKAEAAGSANPADTANKAGMAAKANEAAAAAKTTEKSDKNAAVSIADVKGVYFAVDFLAECTRRLLGGGRDERARGKHVVVVGGGDTGNDCIGTVLRQGCRSVTALEMMPAPPVRRTADNPWPEWPKVLKTDYGHQEAIARFGKDPRRFGTTVKEVFVKNGVLWRIRTVKVAFQNGKLTELRGTEQTLPCDLLLIAAGFTGCQPYTAEAFGARLTSRGNVETAEGPEHYRTNVPKVFTAGDMHRGQSLVVWNIVEGRGCAREVDEFLMGYTRLREQ